MQKMELVPTQNTGIAVINSNTTLKEWKGQALPLAAFSAISKNKASAEVADFGAGNAYNALLAAKATNIDSVAALSTEVRAQALKSMAMRGLINQAKNCLVSNPQRAAVLGAVFNSGLTDILKKFGTYYLKTNSNKIDKSEEEELLKICGEVVRKDYAAFSVAEIEAAFEAAAKTPEIQAYGQLSVKLIHEVLGAYKTRRNKCLSYLLDKEIEEARAIELLHTVAAKNDAAYASAIAEVEAIALCNKKHKTFHTCPHHYVQRMIEDKTLQYSDDDKAQAWADARAYAAHDILHEAQRPDHKKVARSFVATLGITPLHTGRTADDRGAMKQAAILVFDYAAPTKDKFIAFAKIYFSKVLYFRNCAPYTED